MQTPQLILGLDEELLVHDFACGSGMSESIERATGPKAQMRRAA